MGEPGSPRQREPRDHDNGDFIQFGRPKARGVPGGRPPAGQHGGRPVRWPFQRIGWPRAERPIKFAVATLAIGLLIGFACGRLTAPQVAKKSRSQGVVSTPVTAPPTITTALAMTGARCAVQVGSNLQLGIEVMNKSSSTLTLGSIFATFPLGGLRTIAVGLGVCGAWPATANTGSGSLTPGETQWIYATVAVLRGCPEPLPVQVKVGYQSAGQFASTVLAAFPDLGPVPYKHCSLLGSNSSSASVGFVDPASGRSYRR